MTTDINSGNEERQPHITTADEFAAVCGLEILYKGADDVTFYSVSVNRPGLKLAGFDDYFANSRIQVLGNAEMYFLYKMTDDACDAALRKLMEQRLPCIIISRGLAPTKNMLKIAEEFGCTVFRSAAITSDLVNDLINYLNDVLAPKTTVYGELVDIDGVGVLIMGNSGIGKSETALELVHRGHMLVADDAVDVKRVRDALIGTALQQIRDFLEVRGVGVINVRNMYGVRGVLTEKSIDLVIHLEKWEEKKEYDRLGDDKLKENILGVDVPKLLIPVMPGRNIAIVVEVAARNLQLIKLGFNPVDELINRRR